MKLTTLQTIIQAFSCTSDDATRYHLCSVYLEGLPCGSLKVTATNGHILSTVTLKDDDFTPPGGKSWNVAPDSVVSLKAIVKGRKTYGGVTSSLSDSGDIVISDGTTTVTLESAKRDTYPNYQQVIPKEADDRTLVSFNAEYLLDILNALKSNKRQTNVTLSIKDAVNPIRVTVNGTEGEGSERLGVLMPVRVPTSNKVKVAS